ncbi:MAG: pyridoxamine 5'-phosphate oxidase family protein [Chthoniobacteraceae bacterium]
MESNHKNEAEENRQDFTGEEAIAKLRDLVESAQTCFFCTEGRSSGGSAGARPMAVQQVDDEGTLWFLSADDSLKNEEVGRDPFVRLYFQGSAHSEFLALGGVATISRDKEKIRELWEGVMQTWFTEGVDDPRITVIRVVPTEAYYWDDKHGTLIAGIKKVIAAVTGKTSDDFVEGKLSV